MGRRWLPLALIVGALIAVGVGASVGGVSTRDTSGPVEATQPWLVVSPRAQPTELEPSQAPEYREPETTTFWIRVLIGGAIVLAGLYLVIRVIRWLLKQGVGRGWAAGTAAVPLKDRPDAEQVRSAVLAGLADLDEAGDPRRAVIACWLRLERTAHEVGTPRLASDSPGDLVARLLDSHDVDQGALQELARAYRLARYSGHEITEEHRDTARRALSALDTGLRV